MAGYKPHVLDEEAWRRSFQAWNEADWYKDATDKLAQIGERSANAWNEADWYKDAVNQLYVNTPLGDVGRGEIAKIGSGQFADTLLGKAYGEAERGLRETSARTKARDIEAAKRAGGMGAAAMMQAGNSPNSIAASTIYDRMLQKRTGEIQDRSSDELSRGLTSIGTARAAAMPGYLSQAGEWAEAPNRGITQQAQMRGLYDQAKSNAADSQSRNVAQQAAMRGMYDQAKSNATAQRLASMTFEKGKSFWDKFMEGVDDAGKIASTIGTIATGGLFGGGSAVPKPPAPSYFPSSTNYGQLPPINYQKLPGFTGP